MKKVGFIAVIMMFCSFASIAQEKKKMTGLFEGYDGAVYSFSYDDEEYMLFDECEQAVLKEYDLTSDEMLYESFTVTYVKTENDDGDVVLKIVGLLLIGSED